MTTIAIRQSSTVIDPPARKCAVALQGQSTTDPDTRYDRGLAVQKSVFGRMIGNGRDVLLDAITLLLPWVGYARTLNALNALNELAPERASSERE
jgi:hypothetical protein